MEKLGFDLEAFWDTSMAFIDHLGIILHFKGALNPFRDRRSVKIFQDRYKHRKNSWFYTALKVFMTYKISYGALETNILAMEQLGFRSFVINRGPKKFSMVIRK